MSYGRASTDVQGLTSQRHALATLGVNEQRVYVDHGPISTKRDRPGLRQTLDSCRDILIAT